MAWKGFPLRPILKGGGEPLAAVFGDQSESPRARPSGLSGLPWLGLAFGGLSGLPWLGLLSQNGHGA